MSIPNFQPPLSHHFLILTCVYLILTFISSSIYWFVYIYINIYIYIYIDSFRSESEHIFVPKWCMFIYSVRVVSCIAMCFMYFGDNTNPWAWGMSVFKWNCAAIYLPNGLEYHVVNCFSFSLLRPNIVMFHLWPLYDDAKWASLSLYYRKLDYFFERLFWRTTKKSANSFLLALCEGNHRSLLDSLHKCNHNCNHNVSHVVKTMGIDDDVIKWKHFPRYWPYVWEFTGYWPFVGEYTGHWWIPLTKASDAELWCFLWSAPEQTIEQIIETQVIWDATTLTIKSL